MSWMFSSCECGYYNCGICGPHIRESEARREKDRAKAQKQALFDAKLLNSTRMPFGKHKGKRISHLPQSYCYWLLKNAKIVTPGLERLLKLQKGDYYPRPQYVSSYSFDDFDPFDP